MRGERRIPLVSVNDIAPVLTDRAGMAKAINVSQRTVDYLRERGVIPFLLLGKRFVRFDIAKVKQALEQRYEVQAKAKNKAGRADESQPNPKGAKCSSSSPARNQIRRASKTALRSLWLGGCSLPR